jgi:hypothetical protein
MGISFLQEQKDLAFALMSNVWLADQSGLISRFGHADGLRDCVVSIAR